MCRVYYLGTDGPAPLTPQWSESNPSFHVTAIGDTEAAAVAGKLQQKYRVYIGSRDGCGCGFRTLEEAQYSSQPTEERDTTKDHAALAAYLAALPPSETPIQIFGCWSGDENLPVVHTRNFRLSDIIDPEFGFQEREILTLIK